MKKILDSIDTLSLRDSLNTLDTIKYMFLGAFIVITCLFVFSFLFFFNLWLPAILGDIVVGLYGPNLGLFVWITMSILFLFVTNLAIKYVTGLKKT